MPVHPRVRGAKRNETPVKGNASGSPPRSRGKANARLLGLYCGRFTPAFAGQSHASGQRPNAKLGDRWSAVHPRVRGAKPSPSRSCSWPSGSPPRSRGKARVCLCCCTSRTVHPRVRGAKDRRTGATASGTGSPPRSRGKGFAPDVAVFAVRFTPAFAGQRTKSCCTWTRPTVHPRVRGAKASHANHFLHCCGSPPRSRGKGLVGTRKDRK